MRQTSRLIIESGMGTILLSDQACHAVLPTAGTGSRIGGELPKQFQQLAGKPMLAHALAAFIQSPHIQSIWVGVSPSFIDHPLLDELANNKKPIHFLPTGGPTRQETVRNTLAAMLKAKVAPDSWVLVHDAARPGITPDLIEKLITAVQAALSGGLLAIPLADTLKRADLDSVIAGNLPHVEQTIPREHLWQAQTPQMFGLAQLHQALEDAIRLESDITDEASAMELAGFKPLLVEGVIRNFKVTHPADWELMDSMLQLLNKKESSS